MIVIARYLQCTEEPAEKKDMAHIEEIPNEFIRQELEEFVEREEEKRHLINLYAP